MAVEADDEDQEDGKEDKEESANSNGKVRNNGRDGEDTSEDEDEDEEPRLKYASLTKHMKPVYRNGDATSASLVAGDKMIIGTHNGNMHVLSVPSLNTIKTYHAHSASISGLSISPFPPPLAATKLEAVEKLSIATRDSPRPSIAKNQTDSPSSRTPKQQAVPLTPSNLIYIASSSIDGNVVVQSLTESRDVQKRNFGRPVQAVALSPAYKSDRAYLSGGLAGNLVLTVGGRSGHSSTSTTTGGAAAQASGWLGSIGIGADSGRDQVLHSGEGAINTIKFSLSGRYVVWVNEKGIKIMRSNLHLDGSESDLAWKRISHTDHPNRPGWDEMAGIWKAHVQWVDEAGLESDDGYPNANGSSKQAPEPPDLVRLKSPQKSRRSEKLVVGWSGTIWIIDVHPGKIGSGKEVGDRKAGQPELATMSVSLAEFLTDADPRPNRLRIDCIISGISLYTPNLLLVLAYVEPEEILPANGKTARHRRRNALQPEMRIIDIKTKEEVSVADTLNVSRFESLSATDYHLEVLPAMRISNKATAQRGYVEAIGGGIEAIGGGIWDATLYPARLFSSGASVQSNDSPAPSVKASSDKNTAASLPFAQTAEIPDSATLAHGMKIFIHSPYDCVIATKPSMNDHLSWLTDHKQYEAAWKLLDQYPEAALDDKSDAASESIPSTPTKAQGSLVDFFVDSSSQTTDSEQRDLQSQAARKKRRIGEDWVEQLVSAEKWDEAGKTCGVVLGSSTRWEHFVWVFAQANRFDEITPYIPTTHLQPQLPSLVYELMLGHYVQTQPMRLQELLDLWPPELFDASTIIEAIESKLKSMEASRDVSTLASTQRDERIFVTSLAKLYLANGQPRLALSCYIRLQDADAAMALISEYHLVSAVADNIPGFILLRVTHSQQKSAPLQGLQAQTLEPIRLLVSGAHQGIVQPDAVITQLEERYGILNPYLFFYFRALWTGDSSSTVDDIDKASPRAATEERLLALEGKALVSDHADVAVALFAKYDRTLLMTFLKSSQSYTLEKASKICSEREYIPELVYLLSKEGRTAQALRLIIDSLDDVSQAIAFAKEQDDARLWDDLLDYSMNKPRFIRGLLEEVGTSIDPIKLVERIPLGLEIEGLREGLSKMLREYEVQESISSGVARVLRGEVNTAMLLRGAGQKKGVRFEIAPMNERRQRQERRKHHPPKLIRPGYCAGCDDAINEHGNDYLIAFPCAHTFHLSCLLLYSESDPDTESPPILSTFASFASENDDGSYEYSIGPKVDHAALLRTVVKEGCPAPEHKIDAEGEG